MKKIAVGAVGVLTLLVVGAFFWLNSYIYQEKQTDKSSGAEQVSIEGEYLCLPTQEEDTVQSDDCAVGLRDINGVYYALDLGLLAIEPPELVSGNMIRARGVITPIEKISTDYWKKYPIRGIFSVTGSLELIGNSATEEKLIGVYKGVLPCASCSGLETELSIHALDAQSERGSFRLKEIYRGQSIEPIYTEGAWQLRTEGELTLYELQNYQTGDVIASYVIVDEDTVRLYGKDGTAYTSDLPYDLTKESQKVYSPILNNAWIWKETQKSDGNVSAPKSEAFVLTFLPTEEYTSTTDCNSLSGTFIVERERLTLDTPAATKMFCEGSQEMEYTSDLVKTQSYTLDGGALKLHLSGDSGTMLFMPKR